ncbi:MAG TPA: hypothetical protein VFI42_08460 [Thermomicrobiaceae bacterium]|nr:hypothetical protein [Thermomicrobiaceae bacterium]
MPDQTNDRCPACGTPADLGSLPHNTDARTLRRRADHLRLLHAELEREQITPLQVEQMLPRLCASCQGMLTGLSRLAGKGEIESRIEDQIDTLDEQVRLLTS